MFETYLLPTLIFAGIGAAAGILLTAVSRAFAVQTDERKEAVLEALPGVNCGACGYSGCEGYAAAVLSGEAPASGCKAGGPATAEKIARILGVEPGAAEPEVAVVHCRGTCTAAASKYHFVGVSSCAAANRFYNGSKLCTHSCLGLGDCASVCPNGAISILDSVAHINKSKCTGCGLCASACPNQIISIHPLAQKVHVLCSSTEMGKVTREVCSNGCIGCGLCEKKCPQGALHVEGNLARLEPSLCISCGLCAKACPTGALQSCRIQPPPSSFLKAFPKLKPQAPSAGVMQSGGQESAGNP